jgi:hypothetical protein
MGTKPAKKKAKLVDGSTEVEKGLEEEAPRGMGEKEPGQTRPPDPAGTSGSAGMEPQMVSPVPDDRPLFRPAEEDEDEFFPGDDQLCAFLDHIDPAPKPAKESLVIEQEEEEDEFAEEEALLREADHQALLQKTASLSTAGSGPPVDAAPREEPGHDWDDLYQ